MQSMNEQQVLNNFLRKFRKQQFDGVDGECWIWQWAKDKKGFGRFNVAGENRLAHHYAYETFIGIPKEYLQHTCQNKDCVNPHHIEDKKNVGRTAKVSPDIILEFRSKGKSVAEISAELNCSKSLVYKILAQGEKL
jgi:hypothetical protein